MAGELDENDPILAKHFEMAGIKDDPVENADENAGDNADENAQDTDTAVEGKPSSDEASSQGDQEQAPADKDSKGDGTNDGKKQGAKEEPKSAAGPNDLVLPDGEIVKAGKERRWYEQRELARQELKSIQNKVQKYEADLTAERAKVAAYEQATQQINGLPPEQAAASVRLYRDLAADPVGTVKKLLVELKTQGHNIEGIGAGVDTAAVQRMLDQRLKPVEDARPTQDIDREVEVFYNTYPDARIHDDTLAQVITKHPNLSFEEAYYRLRASVIDNGLDWSKPLAPQIAATQNRSAQKPQTPAPMTNGRPAVASTVIERDQNPFSPEGGTTDDIVKAAMREAGINFE